MSVNVSRRWFIGGIASFGALGGCRVFRSADSKYSQGKPNLSFGVVSDVHIRLALSGDGFAKDHDTATLIHTV